MHDSIVVSAFDCEAKLRGSNLRQCSHLFQRLAPFPLLANSPIVMVIVNFKVLNCALNLSAGHQLIQRVCPEMTSEV